MMDFIPPSLPVAAAGAGTALLGQAAADFAASKAPLDDENQRKMLGTVLYIAVVLGMLYLIASSSMIRRQSTKDAATLGLLVATLLPLGKKGYDKLTGAVKASLPGPAAGETTTDTVPLTGRSLRAV